MTQACEPKPLTSTSYFKSVNGSLILLGVGFEECALIVVARPPGQTAADVEALALDVQQHIVADAPPRSGLV